MIFSIIPALQYIKMYWKLFVVGAFALFVAFLFYSIYSLKQNIHTLTVNNITLENDNKNLTVLNERNQDTIKKLQDDLKKSFVLISDINYINTKSLSDVKHLLAELKPKDPMGTSIKECNCTNIKIIPTEGDFIYETISNIGKL
jgi:hypothetical protein